MNKITSKATGRKNAAGTMLVPGWKNNLLTRLFMAKTTLLLIAILSFSMIACGQAFIKGRIRDRQQNFLSASVLLLTADSALIKEVVTDNQGEFVLFNVTPGNY